jgi:hypothetical protein
MDFGPQFKAYMRGLIVLGAAAGVFLTLAVIAIWKLVADHVEVH